MVKSKMNTYSLVKGFCLLFSFVLLAACQSGTDKTSSTSTSSIQDRLDNKEIKYFSNGKRLYTQYCANCHMEDGEGLGKLIPPLNQADYLLKDVLGAAKIIANGQQGEIMVNDIQYNQPMPGYSNLNANQIAELLTYISNAWDNGYGPVDVNDVKEALEK